MGQITNIKEFTDYWKKKYPSVYGHQSDRDIITSVKTRYPDWGIPTYEQAMGTADPEYVEDTGLDNNSEDLRRQKTDPDWVDSWFLTGDFIPDKWQKEGGMGASPDFWRSSFNNSMAGHFYKTMKGYDKWEENPGYEPSWYAQAGQFAVGLLSPLDAMTMVGTGMLGKGASLVGRTGLFGRGAGAKYLKRGILSNFASKNTTIGAAAMSTVEGALSLGVGGGSFAASHAMLRETARQRTENPDKPVNISKALKVASDEFLHAAPMFAIAGGVTQGIMGSIYGYSTAYAAKNASYAAKLTQAATHPIARVGTEAALFTSLPAVFGEEGAPKFNTKEWWGALGTNTLIVGSMRALGSFAEPKGFDAYKFVTSEIKLENNVKRKNAESQKRVVDELTETGQKVPKESTDIVKQYIIDGKKLDVDVKTFKKDLKFIQEMNKLLDDPVYVEKTKVLGSSENIKFGEYSDKVNLYSTGINGIADKVLSGDTHAKELYKEMYGKHPNKEQFKTFKGNIRALKSNTEKNRAWIDEYATGNWRQSTDGINGGDPGPVPQPIRRTTIGGMTREQANVSGGMSDKAIIEKGKKYGVEVTTEKGIVQNREQIIDRIYNQKRAKFQEKEALEKAGVETLREDIQAISGRISPEKIELDVIKNKILERTDITQIPLVKDSGVNSTHKSILAHTIANHKKSRIKKSGTSATKETISLFEYVENKYGKDITKLNPTERAKLAKDYIQKELGIDIYDLSTQDLINKKITERQARALKRKADIVRDNLAEFFTHGELKNIIGELTTTIPKFNVKGARKVAIVGGEKGFEKWRDWVKHEDRKGEIEYLPGKKISSTEADLAIQLAVEGKVRPGELANITVNRINPKTGEIVILRQKKEPPTYINNKKLAQDLYRFAKKRGRSGEDRLFSFKNSKDVSAFSKYLAEKSGTDVRVEHRITGKDYAWENIIPGEAKVGNIEVPARKAGFMLEYGRVFRSLFEGEAANMKAAAIARGHTSTKSTPIYKTKTIQEKRTTRLESEKVFESIADTSVKQKAREKFITKFAKKNNLSESQLKEAILGKGVFGEWVDAADGAIRLQKGIWEPSDFFHENTHRLKSFARETNNKSLMKLIERGESLAKQTKEYKEWKKKNVNRDVEEFLADVAGGKASKMEFSPGLLKKVGQFVKQIVSRIKVAFGAGNFNDYANVVARRVRKGFSTEGVEFTRNQVKYSMDGMTPEAAVKYAKRNLKEIFRDKEISESKMNSVVRHVAEVAGLGKEFKLSKSVSIPELEQFVAYLNTMDKGLIKRIPDKVNWFSNWKEAEQIRVLKNIKESERKTLLKDLEVLDGDMFNASTQQLQDFVQIVKSMDDVKLTTTSWIDQAISERSLNKDMANRFKKISRAKWFLPIDVVLESVGLKTLADRMRNHTSTELRYVGEFSNFEANSKSLFGRRKWDKVKDFIATTFDKERYFERLEKGYITNAQKKFANEMFNINVEKKTMTPKNTEKALLVKSYDNLMEYYREALVGKDGALRQVLNDAQFEKFVNDKNIKWFKDNIYVQRRVTKEFKRYYDPYGRHFETMVKEQTDAIATKLTKRFFKDKKPTDKEFAKKYDSLLDDANAMAYGELYEMFDFNPGKYSPSFLKERHVKLPEKVKLDGKNIEVYETSFSSTIQDYSINQAKFLANIEFFPEFVKLKGFNMPGSKALIQQIRTKDRHLADWVDGKVKDHLQVDKKIGDYPEGVKAVRYTTALAAKFQLSFPTSGLKNFLVGSTQSMLAYRLRDFLGGFASVIYKDNRALVRSTGATEIGMRHFEVGTGLWKGLDKVADKGFFRFGLMKPTENLNRYVSVMAGKRDQLHLSRVIRGSKEGSRRYNAAINKLERFYKLNKEDISLLKEFGMNGVEGHSLKVVAKNKRAVDALYQKMNTFAHINTQGASLNIFMPDWTGSPLAQSALLYKRMAYAATVNSTRNLSIAWQNKSLLQPLMFGLGAYVSGEALIQFYDKLLGQSMPAENSKQGRYLKTVFYKGEMLGILSDLLSPFGTSYVHNTMYPALMSNVMLTFNTFGQMLKGNKFASVGLNEIMKGTSGLYNNTHKLFKQGLLSKDSYVSKDKRARNFFKDMLREYNDRDGIILDEKSEGTFTTTKYMQAYKEAFKAGSVEEAGKWYVMAMFAKANDYYTAGRTESGKLVSTPEQAIQSAVSGMKASIRLLNPNKAAITAKKGTKDWKTQMRKWVQFQEWLDRDFDAGKSKERLSVFVKNTESMYWYRKEAVKKAAQQYISSANVKKDLKYWGIKIGEIL